MEIRIKAITLSDLDQIMEIEPVAFGSHHWSRQSFINELNNPNGYYFAAFQAAGGRLVGYSGFWLIGEEAHITTLAVAPDCRRQYIGERLLIHDIGAAQKVGANWMTLEVRVSNEMAQLLYYKYGFKSLGFRRNYYQDNGEDALVLWTEQINSADFKALVEKRRGELEEALARGKVEPTKKEESTPGALADGTCDTKPQMEV